MNTNLLRTLIAVVVGTLSAAAAQIPAGTHVLLRVENSISTKTAQAGDGVHLRTVSPINAGGKIVVPVGSYAQGIVERVRSAKLAHREASLAIRLTSLFLPGGEVVTVSGRSSSFDDGEYKSARHRSVAPFVLAAILIGIAAGGENGARIGTGAAGGAILIPELMRRGREVELRQGTTVDMLLEQPVQISD